MMVYSDISPRTTAYADKRLLTRAIPNNILGQFGQVRNLPEKSTQVIKFRRYNKLAVATTPLTEGVTPSGKTLTKTDVQATVGQYGDFVTITDVVRDTHEDPVLQEAVDILGEQAAETWDVLRFNVLKAGTNVAYANGTQRDAVNTVFDASVYKRALRILKRQEAKTIREIVGAGPNIQTNPIAAAYIAVCHTDLQYDLEALTGWIPVQQYASTSGLIRGEIGAYKEFRFVIDNNCVSWANAGASQSGKISTGGTLADIYPILVFGKDAYGIVPLGGKTAVSTYVANPKPSENDPLAQRGTVGWKGWTTTAILNDLWMLRIEVAATA